MQQIASNNLLNSKASTALGETVTPFSTISPNPYPTKATILATTGTTTSVNYSFTITGRAGNMQIINYLVYMHAP